MPRRCPSKTQTVVLPKSTMTKRQAVSWARRHGFVVYKIDETANYWRIRQLPPGSFVRLRTKRLPNGVLLVLGPTKRCKQ